MLTDIIVKVNGSRISCDIDTDDGWWLFTPWDKNDEDARVAALEVQETYDQWRTESVDELTDQIDPWMKLVAWLRNIYGDESVTYKKVEDPAEKGRVY